MFYRYDSNQLKFVKDKLSVKIALGTTILLMVGSFFIGRHFQSDTLDTIEGKIRIINLQKERDKFSKDKFVNELKNNGIKFPHIVMAQAIVESGLGRSDLFKSNNNLYYLFLSAHYAEAPTYSQTIKNIVDKQKLKSYFNE